MLVSFYHNNPKVSMWEYKHDEDCLSITTYSPNEFEQGENIKSVVMVAVGILGIGLAAGLE